MGIQLIFGLRPDALALLGSMRRGRKGYTKFRKTGLQ
jgi:hypothetical protein